MQKYHSQNTIDIEINGTSDAIKAVMHFCDYCLKDAASRTGCKGKDKEECDAVKRQMMRDFGDGTKKKNKKGN